MEFWWLQWLRWLCSLIHHKILLFHPLISFSWFSCVTFLSFLYHFEGKARNLGITSHPENRHVQKIDKNIPQKCIKNMNLQNIKKTDSYFLPPAHEYKSSPKLGVSRYRWGLGGYGKLFCTVCSVVRVNQHRNVTMHLNVNNHLGWKLHKPRIKLLNLNDEWNLKSERNCHMWPPPAALVPFPWSTGSRRGYTV